MLARHDVAMLAQVGIKRTGAAPRKAHDKQIRRRNFRNLRPLTHRKISGIQKTSPVLVKNTC